MGTSLEMFLLRLHRKLTRNKLEISKYPFLEF